MDQGLLENLKEWRLRAAEQEGVPVYRIFNNETLEGIASIKPKDKQELLAIKGIRDKKLAKYGEDILTIIQAQEAQPENQINQNNKQEDKPYQVSDYLNWINNNLRKQSARVIGEISSLNIQATYLFFSLKDKKDESLLSCFMWRRDYDLSGIKFEEGMEIIVHGYPEVYKPNGRFSLRVSTAELVGEGALKKAYLALKKKLEEEGLFSLERKKQIPEFSQKIGLITSSTGAVIHDFLNNLGQYGYQIKFYSSRVEGQTAVKDLLSGIEYFQNQEIDVLAIIRGGGSLESLQAFNNEVLIKKIAEFKQPIICGIGHDKDVPLACLAADMKASTPTTVSIILNQSWEKGIQNIKLFEREIVYQFKDLLIKQNKQLDNLVYQLKTHSSFVFKRFSQLENQFREKVGQLGYEFKNFELKLNDFSKALLNHWQKKSEQIKEYLEKTSKRLNIFDPKRQLKLGYSIVSLNNRVIKKITGIKQGDKLDIRVSDGKIRSEVKKIINQ